MINRDTVDQVLTRISKRADYEYFFGKIDSPEWIVPLRETGLFFKRPPAIERTDDLIRVPNWPESQYLARMAGKASALVMDVISEIPDTPNPRVLEDYVTACLAMPAEVAARIAPQMQRWAPEARGLLFPKRLGELVIHLAKGGEDAAALTIAGKLLAPDSDGIDGSDWEYGEVLKALVQEIPTRMRMQFLALLADLVSTSLDRKADATKPEDYSYIWRPAVEEHSQNIMSGLRDQLVSAIRDLTESTCSEDPGKLAELVELMEGRQWIILRRIALHSIRCAGNGGELLAKARLLDRNVGGDIRLHHEYVLLLKVWFPILTSAEQESILSRITEGLDIEHWREVTAQHLGRSPSKEEEERRIAYYFVQQLTPIAGALPPEWAARLDGWLAIAGPAEHPEFRGYHSGGFVGPTSPLTEDDLRLKDCGEVIHFLRIWHAATGLGHPSAEGLGRTLSAVVQEDPARFAKVARDFTGLDPTYVRSLLFGLTQAAKAGSAFDWCAVLSLCGWVVEQPRDDAPRTDTYYLDLDPGWGWTRTEIGRLLAEGFESAADTGLPTSLRKQAWNILTVLAEDPDPTVEEDKRDGESHDAYTSSINSTRGVAMNAVVRYAIWVRRHKDGEGQWDFDHGPEVRDILDRHLDPDVEPRAAIRAVYGFWLPNLVALDRAWVQSRLDRIFPAEAALRRLRKAAWVAYISFSHPYDNVLEILTAEYRAALMALDSADQKSRSLADARIQLAQHLMVFYWRGKVTRDSEDGLISLFFSRASDALRGEALDFVGRSLHDEEAEVPTEILARLKTLWEWRVDCAESERAIPAREELGSFGSWYASGRFNPHWAINQLLRALRISKAAEPEHWVIERLQKDCATFPLEVIQCLELLIEGDTKGWHVMSWRDDIRAIVRVVLGSQNTELREAAMDLVHKLGARGHFDFRDLIANNGA